MKNARIILIVLAGLFTGLTSELNAQVSPDKMISYMRDKGDAYAFTLPGWLVRFAGNIADNNLEDDEAEMVQELTNHIKKIRFAVTEEELPEDFAGKYASMIDYLNENEYEPLIKVRDGNTDVNIWGLFDGNIIERLIISTTEEGSNTVLFNIKSDIDMERLQSMAFFKELNEKNKL